MARSIFASTLFALNSDVIIENYNKISEPLILVKNVISENVLTDVLLKDASSMLSPPLSHGMVVDFVHTIIINTLLGFVIIKQYF